jgi:hypothetical protein
MALTIGRNLGLFSGIGSYENGDFEHTFAKRPVWDASELEQAEVMRTYTGAGVPAEIAAQRSGWKPTEVDELRQALVNEQAQAQNEQGTVASVLAGLRNGR